MKKALKSAYLEYRFTEFKMAYINCKYLQPDYKQLGYSTVQINSKAVILKTNMFSVYPEYM